MAKSAPAYTTKAPSGLDIKREGNKFVFTWKSQDSDIEYQELEYWCYDSNNRIKKSWKNGTVNGYTTEAVDNFVGNIVFPYYVDATQIVNNSNGAGRAPKIVFYVRQRRKDFQDYYYTGSGRNKKKVAYSNKTDPKISAWAKKEFEFANPNSPDLSWTYGDEDGDTQISWAFRNKNDTDRKAAFKFVTQALWIKECNTTDGSKLNWSGASYVLRSTENSKTIERSGTSTTREQSSMQWFRCKVLGGGRSSDWKYICRVFSYPNRASNVQGSASVQDANSMILNASWTVAQSAARPCESAQLQWAMAVPRVENGNLVAPPNVSWQNTTNTNQIRPNDTVRLQLSAGYEDDQCLFARINTYHDRYETLGLATLMGIGHLAMPDGLNISITSVDTHTATVRANNNSSVEGSFLAIYYRGEKTPQNTLLIGIIPWDGEDTEVVFPDDGSQQPAWGVEAIVGNYTERTRADGVTEYTVTKKMSSAETLWKKFDVPFPPANVKAVPVEGKDGTVKVTWDWSWRNANKAEVSWADSDDAWESTEEPSTHLITNRNRSHVYVKNIEIGKKWYFAMRLIKEDDDETLQSAWTKPATENTTVDLAAPPKKPSLVLSQNAVPIGGSVTASWTYDSSDGTIQAHADICTVTLTQAGAVYGQVVAYTTTQKHITLEAQETAGDVLYAVRTVSASGKESEWSDPVPLTTVQPIAIEIGELPNNVISDTPIPRFTTISGSAEVTNADLFYDTISEGKEIDTVSVDTRYSFYRVWKFTDTRSGAPTKAGLLNGYAEQTSQIQSDHYWEWFPNWTAEDWRAKVITTQGETILTNIQVVPDDHGFFSVKFNYAASELPDEPYTDVEVEFRCKEFEAIAVESGGGASWGFGDMIPFAGHFGLYINEDAIPETTEFSVRKTIYEGSDETLLNVMRELPFTVPITTTGVVNSINVHLERNGAYYAPYPDDNNLIGYDREIVMSRSVMGQPANVVLGLEDKLSSVDDGALYTIVATAKDGVGQVAEDRATIIVRWTDQAKMPTAVAEADGDIVKITPTATGAAEGSVCDIYRLSADKPEQIIKGGQWGVTYVDPYPALGEFGGHRVVYRTKNEDYIMDDGNPAWVDLGMAEDDYVDPERAIIEFGGDKIILTRNVDIDSAWQKDFTETKYMGGSVQGDWNAAVSRTGSINSVAITLTDEYTIKAMRRLATHAGICHVRTQDGSSFNANIDVTESRPHDVYGTRATFSMSITRVDPQGLEGLTLAEWKAQNGLE